MQLPLDQPRVLHSDRQMLVVHKPAGMLSQPDATGDLTIADWAREWLVQAAGRQETGYNPFVAPAHRLDRPASGLLVLARTSRSADRLAAQFRDGSVRKAYLAAVAGLPGADTAAVRLWLLKDRTANRVRCLEQPHTRAWEAVTRVQVLTRGEDATLVALFPDTGRPHQLRATMAHMGHPIAGDVKYGAEEGFGHWIALHSCLLSVLHPTERRVVTVTGPVPAVWRQQFPRLMGCLPPWMVAP